MLAGPNHLTLVVHFDPLAGGGDGQRRILTEQLQVAARYCQWAAEHTPSVAALLPAHFETHYKPILANLERVTVIWYSDEVGMTLPDMFGRQVVWLVNGNRLPIVDWEAARSASRRPPCDVLLFGPPRDLAAVHYPESVQVDETGRVLSFRRHYFDSPTYADRWSGEACFLAVGGRDAHAVVGHVVARGWGLESIGALTRRFCVRWSSEPCVRETDLRLVRSAGGEYSLPAVAASSRRPTGGGTDWPTDSKFKVQSSKTTERDAPVPLPFRTSNFELPTSFDVTQFHDCDYESKRRGVASCSRAATLTPCADGNGNGRDGCTHEASERTSSKVKGQSSKTTERDAPVPPPFRTSNFELPTSAGSDRGYLVLKRLMDVCISGAGLLLLSPFLLVVAILLKCTSRGPILFSHRRQGLQGKEFRCLKFRSMMCGAEAMKEQLRELNEVDGPQFKISADPRLTKLGRWLRRYNIDEVPQLLNVLFGHMSLVGPRPSPDDENQLCPAWRRARLSVKPGITGLWQVLRLRDDPDTDFQEWIYYDVEYARHRSLWLDWHILLNTPWAIFAPRRLSGFTAKLARIGICRHAGQIGRQPVVHVPV